MENDNQIDNRKIWWLSGLLSFLVPGLGQVYNGEATKGLFFNFLISTWGGLVFSLLYYLMQHPITSPRLLLIFLVFFISIVAELLIILEAIRAAMRIGDRNPPRRYNRWYVYVLVIFLVTVVDDCVSAAFRDNVLKAYQIPSGSMRPTIEAGDHLICNQLYYRSNNPARGDLIIFKYPEDESIDYIKRIIGLPGDRIELIRDTLYVNGEALDEPYAKYDDNGVGGPVPVKYGPYYISDNEYFVMGDNRNNSSDSREFGTITRQSIRGKAVFVYFSWDNEISKWNIIGRLFSIRFSRIGEIL
jgi:signal peptidase I